MARQAAVKVEESSSAVLALFKALPVKARKELNYNQLKSLTGAVLIEDAIHEAYSQCAKVLTELRRKKRAHGYCGGEPSCLTFVGLDQKGPILCSSCRALAKQRREGIQFLGPRKQTEYGRIRAKLRAQEKSERGRLLGRGT